MTRHVSLLLMASLIILNVGGSISIGLRVSPSSIKGDHNMLKLLDMKRLMNKRALCIEDGVLLQTKTSTGETYRRDNVFNEFNDWAILKDGRLWDDNLIRRMKKEDLGRRGKKTRDDTLVRMI